MSAELLAGLAGIVLSLAFSYIPKLNEGYAGLDATKKRLIMLGLMVLVALGAFGLSCAKLVEIGITCDQAGAWALAKIFIAAVVANQGAYLISPEAKRVSVAKAARG
jgi:hypothetical protein